MLLPGSFYAPEDYPRTHPDCLAPPALDAPHRRTGPVLAQAQPSAADPRTASKRNTANGSKDAECAGDGGVEAEARGPPRPGGAVPATHAAGAPHVHAVDGRLQGAWVRQGRHGRVGAAGGRAAWVQQQQPDPCRPPRCCCAWVQQQQE